MIQMLKTWEGTVEINGIQYTDGRHATGDFKPVSGQICIKLYPKQKKTENEAGINEKPLYKITVKNYMTEKASPDFDFMSKWNGDNPMPLRTMTGWVEKETRGMVYMHLHGVGEPTIKCMRCGKTFTNPISKHYGIGPDCMQKLGIVADIDDVENIKKELVNVEWSGWVIKSAITKKEEI